MLWVELCSPSKFIGWSPNPRPSEYDLTENGIIADMITQVRVRSYCSRMDP